MFSDDEFEEQESMDEMQYQEEEEIDEEEMDLPAVGVYVPPPVQEVQPEEDVADMPLAVFVQEAPGTPFFQINLEIITDHSQQMDKELGLQIGDELYQRWIHYPSTFSASKMLDCAFSLYGFTYNDILNEEILLKRETDFTDGVMQLYYRFVHEKWVDPTSAESVGGQRFVRILEMISTTAAQIRLYSRTLNLINPGVSVASATLQKWRLTAGEGEKEPTPYQHLLVFLLNSIYGQNLRKYNGRLYKQVIILSEGQSQYRTHAWQMSSEIQDFIYTTIDRYTNYDMWLNLTASHNNITSAINYLKNCRDFEIPTLDPNRHVFSFKNCVYDATYNRVYKYGDDENPIPLMLVSSKYFDIEFPVDMADVNVDFRDIPTPKLDHILNHQKISTDLHDIPGYTSLSVRDWFYVFIGRMIYEIGEFDDWQCLMFIKGIAGSGKSTIGKIISYMYDAGDVGVLSNNTEKKFGLSALVDKKIYICYEVKNDFTLDQGEFQSMVSGEQMSIPVKFSTASSVWWKSHGIFMGNEIANWVDNSGSMSRRIILGVFNQRVVDSNPGLFAELQGEMGAIILKCNRAYRQAARQFGKMDIWKALPPYFIVNRRKFRSETHALASFLENGKTIKIGPEAAEYCVTLDELSNLMRMYIQNEPSGVFKRGTKQFNEDFYLWVLEDYGLKLKMETRLYKGELRFEKYVDGIMDVSSPSKIELVEQDAFMEIDNESALIGV